MNWQDALEIVVARTKHAPYRQLCSDANTQPAPNNRDAYRREMIRQAAGPAPDPLPDITVSDEERRAAEQWPPPVRPCGGC